jgi:hypothetical protein
MMSRRFLRLAEVLVLSFIALLAGPPAMPSRVTAAEPHVDDRAGAERLVEAALEADLEGRSQERSELIQEALRQWPGCEAARWNAGQVLLDKRWQSVEQVQRTASQDAKLAEYRRLRAQAGDKVNDQFALARWCRRKGLKDEERAHLTRVLIAKPNHAETLDRLGLRWYQGSLLTGEQIKRRRAEKVQARRDLDRWRPVLLKLRRELSDASEEVRARAQQKLLAIRDTASISAIDSVLLKRRRRPTDKEIRLALDGVAALGNFSDLAATHLLTKQAVLADVAEVRHAAANALRPRPWHDFVPLLLGELRLPVEVVNRITTDVDGTVRLEAVLYQERQNDTLAWVHLAAFRRTSGNLLVGDRRQGELRIPADPATFALIDELNRRAAEVTRRRLDAAAQANRAKVEQLNERVDAWNRRIQKTLTLATGKSQAAPFVDRLAQETTPVNPSEWWSWWIDYNDQYASSDKPTHTYSTSSIGFYRGFGFRTFRTPYSCFVHGTIVSTLTGPVAVEKIRVGDRVLSQDPQTGQLAFKPVLATTVRPKVPTLRLNLGSESITTTRGHPLWVAGKGWRTAKRIAKGDRLHTMDGSLRVEDIKPAADQPVYNLVVADFATYFVGKSRVLAHDNTPRQPTSVLLPGFSPVVKTTGR